MSSGQNSTMIDDTMKYNCDIDTMLKRNVDGKGRGGARGKFYNTRTLLLQKADSLFSIRWESKF